MPQELKYQLAYTLNSIRAQAGPAPGRSARRLSFIGILAVVLLIAMIAAAVGNSLGVFRFMERMPGAGGVLEGAGELVQTDLGSLDMPNTLLAAEEAVYDGGCLRVVYSVQAKNLATPPLPADMDNPESAFCKALAGDGIHLDGSCDWFVLDGTEYSMTNGSTGDAVFDEESGKLYCYLEIQLASDGIIPKGDFDVKLPLAGELMARKTLDITVKASLASQPKAVFQAGQVTVSLLNAFLSPVRAYATVRIEMKEGSTLSQADKVFDTWRDVVLVDAKGKEIRALADLLTVKQEDGKSVVYSYTFLPIDKEEIFLAPIVTDENNNWVGDMSQALRLK
jgi:hypothetical protein